MRLQVPPALARLLSPLGERIARLGEWRFWLEGVALTLCALLAAAAWGRSSLLRAAELSAEAERLEEVRVAMNTWAAEMQPAAAAESAAWRESDRLLRSLDGSALDPLSAAELLTERAEEVGLRDVRVQFANADSIEAPPPVQAGDLTAGAGDAPILVDFVGGWPAVLAFLGAVPVTLQVSSVQVSSGESGVQARAVLFTRTIQSP